MKSISRYLLAIVALVAMSAALFTACGGDDDDSAKKSPTAAPIVVPTFAADSSMAAIVKKGKLVVGVKFDQPGFGQLDPVSKKVDGFDVAIAKEIAKSLGLKDEQIEFIESVSKDRIPFLQTDKVDLVIATMTINAERKTQIEFSKPYYQAGQSILVKKDNTTIKAVTDLNGKKVCSVKGSTSEKNVKEKAPTSDLLTLDAYSACVSSLKDGRVEAVSTDDIILAGYAATDATIKLVGGQFTKEPYGIGIKKGDVKFCEFINKTLKDNEAAYNKAWADTAGKVEGASAAKLPEAAACS